MVMNVLCLTTLIGLSNALTTLVSQSYGQKEYRLCGIYLNRARLLMIILFFALLIPFQFAKHAFMLLGLDEDSSSFAQKYMNISILGVLFN